MGPVANRPRRRFAGLGVFGSLFWAVVFAAACGQAPLYYSNQNQYLLHGLAAAHVGDLEHDWLARTLDPTPAFTAVIAQFAETHIEEWAIPAVFAVLQGIYFISLVGLIDGTLGLPRSRPARFVLLTLLVTVHSAAARYASLYVTGTAVPQYLHRAMDPFDAPRFLTHGLALQYLLGPGLQPSAFGVFLVASLAAFARGRLFFCVLFAGIACGFHATYLLPAALLTVTYILVLIRGGRWGAAFLLAIGMLLVVAPVVWYAYTTFAPTTPEQFSEAQRFVIEKRIPHHAVVHEWFDRIARLQVTWIALGMIFALRSRLFLLLAIPAILGVLLTLLQLAPSNPAIIDWLRARGVTQDVLDQATEASRTLALLFPWRISVILIPVSTAAIITRIVAALTPYPGHSRMWGWIARLFAFVLLAVVVAGGVYITFREPQLLYPENIDERPVLDYVKEHHQPGEVYLYSVDADKLERFRLMAGAAVYADWKSIPYKDVEVLDWHRRIDNINRWFDAKDWDAIHDELVKEGITHVVIPTANAPEATKGLNREYGDDAFTVYKLRQGP
jgi:hypothetical protein